MVDPVGDGDSGIVVVVVVVVVGVGDVVVVVEVGTEVGAVHGTPFIVQLVGPEKVPE